MEDMHGPLPFITLSGTEADAADRRAFVVHEEAARCLLAVEGPVAVVTIAGLYRTGKSYILNRLAGSAGGFAIGSTVEPCTQGIWIWIVNGSQIQHDDFRRDTTLILLDTEGLGSYSKTKTYDVQIFSISVLLSSFFIYNSLGNIDETALDRLSLVVELSKHIRVQSDATSETAEDLHAFFPKFLWLLRDFSLKLSVNGKDISAKEYLETSLAPLSGDTDKVKDKNAIRNSIRQYFTDRSCFTMRRPVNDEKLLQHMETAKESDLRPQFVEELHHLVKLIYTQTPSKRLYRQVLNGPMLLQLTRNYVDAINKGSVPTIRTAWENVIEIENQKVVDRAMALYSEKVLQLTKNGVFEVESFEELHQSSVEDAREFFSQNIKGESVASYDKKLMKQIQEYRLQALQDNEAKSSQLCERWMTEVVRNVWSSVEKEQAPTMDGLRDAWERCIENDYLPNAKGPRRDAILLQFVRQHQLAHGRLVASRIAQNLESEFAKKVEEQKQSAKSEYARLEKLYNDVNLAWDRTKQDLQASQEENAQLIQTIAKLSAVLNEDPDE